MTLVFPHHACRSDSREGRASGSPASGARPGMSRARPRVLFALLALGLLALDGCYSFTGSGLPAGMRTVEIPQVVDRALQPELADQATQLLVAEFRRNGQLRPVDDGGDARVTTTLQRYQHQPASLVTSGTVTRFSITVALSVKFEDLGQGDVLFESSDITGTSTYDPAVENEYDARARALREAVRKLVDNTISGW